MQRRYINIKTAINILFLFCYLNIESRPPEYQGQVAATELVNAAWTGEGNIGKYTRKELIDKLMEIIYTNNGRQSLANWMYDRRPYPPPQNGYGRNKNSILATAQGDRFVVDSPFGQLLQNISNNAGLSVAQERTFNTQFSQLVNLAFPCWTGTLTCYMHNNPPRVLQKLPYSQIQ